MARPVRVRRGVTIRYGSARPGQVVDSTEERGPAWRGQSLRCRLLRNICGDSSAWTERLPPEEEVGGSNPSRRADGRLGAAALGLAWYRGMSCQPPDHEEGPGIPYAICGTTRGLSWRSQAGICEEEHCGCSSAWTEHRLAEPGVGGSNPSSRTERHVYVGSDIEEHRLGIA